MDNKGECFYISFLGSFLSFTPSFFYARQFDYKRGVVSVRAGLHLTQHEKGWTTKARVLISLSFFVPFLAIAWLVSSATRYSSIPRAAAHLTTSAASISLTPYPQTPYPLTLTRQHPLIPNFPSAAVVLLAPYAFLLSGAWLP